MKSMLKLIECAHMGGLKRTVTYQSSRQHYCVSPLDGKWTMLVSVETASPGRPKSAIGQLVDAEPQVKL